MRGDKSRRAIGVTPISAQITEEKRVCYSAQICLDSIMNKLYWRDGAQNASFSLSLPHSIALLSLFHLSVSIPRWINQKSGVHGANILSRAEPPWKNNKSARLDLEAAERDLPGRALIVAVTLRGPPMRIIWCCNFPRTHTRRYIAARIPTQWVNKLWCWCVRECFKCATMI